MSSPKVCSDQSQAWTSGGLSNACPTQNKLIEALHSHYGFTMIHLCQLIALLPVLWPMVGIRLCVCSPEEERPFACFLYHSLLAVMPRVSLSAPWFDRAAGMYILFIQFSMYSLSVESYRCFSYSWVHVCLVGQCIFPPTKILLIKIKVILCYCCHKFKILNPRTKLFTLGVWKNNACN